jgi:hypothetical protein
VRAEPRFREHITQNPASDALTFSRSGEVVVLDPARRAVWADADRTDVLGAVDDDPRPLISRRGQLGNGLSSHSVVTVLLNGSATVGSEDGTVQVGSVFGEHEGDGRGDLGGGGHAGDLGLKWSQSLAAVLGDLCWR